MDLDYLQQELSEKNLNMEVLHFLTCKMDSSSRYGQEKASHMIRVLLSQTSLQPNVLSDTMLWVKMKLMKWWILQKKQVQVSSNQLRILFGEATQDISKT